MIDDQQLAQRLLELALVSRDALERAVSLQQRDPRPLYHILIAHQLAHEQDVVRLAAQHLNLPFIWLADYELNDEATALLPGSIATRNRVLPLRLRRSSAGDELVLAMEDPLDIMAMDEIASQTGINLQPVLVGPRDLDRALASAYPQRASSAAQSHEDPFSDLGAMPEEGVGAQDSWAAFFDEANLSPSAELGDSASISQEMRARPSTIALDLMDDDIIEQGDLMDEEEGDELGAMDDALMSLTDDSAPIDLSGWEVEPPARSSRQLPPPTRPPRLDGTLIAGPARSMAEERLPGEETLFDMLLSPSSGVPAPMIVVPDDDPPTRVQGHEDDPPTRAQADPLHDAQELIAAMLAQPSEPASEPSAAQELVVPPALASFIAPNASWHSAPPRAVPTLEAVVDLESDAWQAAAEALATPSVAETIAIPSALEAELARASGDAPPRDAPEPQPAPASPPEPASGQPSASPLGKLQIKRIALPRPQGIAEERRSFAQASSDAKDKLPKAKPPGALELSEIGAPEPMTREVSALEQHELLRHADDAPTRDRGAKLENIAKRLQHEPSVEERIAQAPEEDLAALRATSDNPTLTSHHLELMFREVMEHEHEQTRPRDEEEGLDQISGLDAGFAPSSMHETRHEGHARLETAPYGSASDHQLLHALITLLVQREVITREQLYAVAEVLPNSPLTASSLLALTSDKPPKR